MNDALLPAVLQVMCRLAALAAAVNALELIVLRPQLANDGVWQASVLRERWRGWHVLLEARAFMMAMTAQLSLAVVLAVAPNTALGCAAASGLTLLAWLSSLRMRGNVNGGSDAMLFTVLGGLTVAQLPSAPMPVHEAGVLYVAAQVTLSYVRAGLVKVRQRDWWTGRALAVFLALPAYGVPRWVPERVTHNKALLRSASIGVMAFECLAPVAWLHPTACAAVIGTAVVFHLSTAALFGLNRFLLAWSAALPSLWYAVHRMP